MIDTHTHIDSEVYAGDIDQVLDRARSVGIKAFVVPAAHKDDLVRARELAHKHADIFFAVGTHPNYADQYDEQFLREFIADHKCVAIGECGLDYYYLPKDDEHQCNLIRRRQKEVFAAQIELAREFDLPLIVHIRDASDDTMQIILDSGFQNGGVLHCFNADEQLIRLADHGFFFGIGGVLTFKNARKLPTVLPKIPLDRLVLETDAPYLTPHPHRGTRNEPAYTDLVVEKMSEVLSINKQELISITTQNALKCFPRIDLIGSPIY